MAKNEQPEHLRQRQQSEEQTPSSADGSQVGSEPINQQEQQQAVEFNNFSGTPGSALGPENDSAIDEASAESFPASDPPAWSRNGL